MQLLAKIIRRLLPGLAPLAIAFCLFSPCPAVADIYTWEWVDPNDHSLGKRESTVLAPDGAGLTAAPNLFASRRDLTQAYLVGAELTNANFVRAVLGDSELSGADLTNANLSRTQLCNANLTGANLTAAYLRYSTLTNADITNAEVRDAYFDNSDISPAQLSSTSSYQAGNLVGLHLQFTNLSSINFVGQNLSGADFTFATLTSANLSGAVLTNVSFFEADLSSVILKNGNLFGVSFSRSILVNADLSEANLSNASLFRADITDADLEGAKIRGVDFYATTGLTAEQLYATASYQLGDFTSVSLRGHDLTGWNFANQNLSGANFGQSDLANAEFTNAEVRGTNLSSSNFTVAQLYSTVSYQQCDLTGTLLGATDLLGSNFTGVDLTDASFSSSNLSNAIFTGANIRGVRFDSTTDKGFRSLQLYSTASYQDGDLTGIDLNRNDMTGWDFLGKNLTDADFRIATLESADFTNSLVRGAKLRSTTDKGFVESQLYSTASYQNRDLAGIGLEYNNLALWNFSSQNLAGSSFEISNLSGANLSGAILLNAYFSWATLSGANLSGADLSSAIFNHANLTDVKFTDARVIGANFTGTTSKGFVSTQLYETASYRTGDFEGINLLGNDLTGWNFAGQNLTGATLVGSTLLGANLDGADTRGATFMYVPPAGSEQNLIRPNGQIKGLNILVDEVMRIRDYNGETSILILVQDSMSMDTNAILRMEFEDADWGSTISFDAGIPVDIAGTLDLIFADVDPASLLGTTFELFDWTGVTPVGTFDAVTSLPGAVWDTSELYTSGDVTLLGYKPWAVGDFNADGVVDGRDFLMWQREESPEPFSQTDLDFWRINFAGAALAEGSLAVPEPGVEVLAGLALMACCLRSWRRQVCLFS